MTPRSVPSSSGSVREPGGPPWTRPSAWRRSRLGTPCCTSRRRPRPTPPGAPTWDSAAAADLLAAAALRLGRPCERLEIPDHSERAVVAASAHADLLIVARDGDR